MFRSAGSDQFPTTNHFCEQNSYELPPILLSDIEYLSAAVKMVVLLWSRYEARASSQTDLIEPDHRIQVRRLTEAMKDWWEA